MSEFEEMMPSEEEEFEASNRSEDDSRHSVRFGENADIFSNIESDQPEEEQTPSSSLSSAESVIETLRPGSFVLRKKLPVVPDFFLTLGTLPSLDQISLDPSMDIEGKPPAEDEMSQLGEEEEEVPAIEPAKPSEPEHKTVQDVEEEHGEEEATVSSEISELKFDFESEEEEVAPKRDEEMAALEVLFESDAAKPIDISPDDELIAKMLQLEQEQQLRKEVITFIDRVIAYAVQTVEYVDPNDVLRENLDKKKLFKALVQIMVELQVERTTNEFMQRKCVDFFRRNKKLRPITPDPEETYYEEQRKYNYAIETLDSLLGKEAEKREHFNNEIEKLEEEEANGKKVLEQEVESLESFIKNTFKKRSSDHLDTFVLKRIKEIRVLSKEISSTMLVLLRYNDTMNKLNEEQAKFEDLGGGLKLHQYISLQTEAIQLSKKLEERNEDLERFRSQFVNHTHALAHIKERQIMLFHQVQALDRELDRAQTELIGWREYLNDLKIKRIRVKMDIRERSFQNGLLEMPALLLEFDTTMDRIKELKSSIEEFKQTAAKFEFRLKRIGERQHPTPHHRMLHGRAIAVHHAPKHRSK